MTKVNIELRSPKVQNIIGKIPRGLVLGAILTFLIVIALIIVVLLILNIEPGEIFNRTKTI